MPKVNIIIPVYNQEKYIGKCLETVINQTEKDIEAIVVDDKSKDKSLEIIKKYEEQYPNIIKVLENPINKGVAYTRNKALEIADGEYGAIEIKLGANKEEEAVASLKRFYELADVKPKFMCVICGLYDAVVKRPDGIYVLPITALKP